MTGLSCTEWCKVCTSRDAGAERGAASVTNRIFERGYGDLRGQERWYDLCYVEQFEEGESVEMFRLWSRPAKSSRPRSLYGNLIAYLQTRLVEQPADVRLRLSLVTHLEMARRYDEAVREVQEILRLDPHHRRAKALLLRLRLEQRLAGFQRAPRS